MSALSAQQVRRIRVLRYEDGLSAREVALLVGCHETTVWRIAPGRPGKVSNAAVRAIFEQSGLTAAEVARRMDWVDPRSPGSGDSARVKRALGLLEDVNGGRRARRTRIDAETAGQLAEAMGHEAWEGCPE